VPSDEPTPRTVVVAAGVVAAEGGALVALSLSYAGLLLAAHPHNRSLALFGAALGLLCGLVLLVAARGLRQMRRPAYSPTVLVQLLAIPVGIGLIQGQRAAIAVAVLVPSAVVLALLMFTPTGRSVLTRE
jgi:hypothetical protein